MSSFYCEWCKAEIVDTPQGYVTECEHYPLDLQKANKIAMERMYQPSGDMNSSRSTDSGTDR